MPTLTGSGALVFPAMQLSGIAEILSPDSGPTPDTRQSTISFDLTMSGDYFDELDGIINDRFPWKASGFKFTDRTGDGSSTAGQSNRFWYKRNLKIPYGSHVDLDLFSYLSVNAGKGLGQDGLGLGITTDKITMLLIRNKLNGSNLVIGGATTAPWTPLLDGTITLPPGNFLLFQTRSIPAWPVVQGTSQYLRLAPTGTDSEVDVYIAGRDTQ